MTRRLFASLWLVLSLTTGAWSQTKPAPPLAEKPSVTIVLPTLDELFADMEFAFQLADDPKGFKTLKETIEVFTIGVETNVPSALRVYSSGNNLAYVLSLPVKNQQDFNAFLMNMWDIDVKTMEPPKPALLPQVPAAIRTKHRTLKLAKSERLMFKLYDGFLRFDDKTHQVHLGEQVAEVRHAKAGLSPLDLKGQDFRVEIDGTVETPEKRRASFAKAKGEILGALKKGEKEAPATFELRKALTEHQVAEVERFFAESDLIEMGWITSAQNKNATFAIDLTATPGTALDASAEQLGQTPDAFAGISAEGTVLKGSINFPLDPLRQDAVKSIAKLARASLQGEVERQEKLSDDQKQADKALIDLVFDVVDGIGTMGVFNGFLRGWSNADGSITAVGAATVPDGGKFIPILQQFAARGNAAQVQLQADAEGDVAIHKLVVADLKQDYPEIFPGEGTIYVGTAAKSVWLASGDKSLERLKLAIQEAAKSGPQPGPTMDGQVAVRPFIEIFDKIHTRQKPAPVVKPKDKKKPAGKADAGDKPAAEKAKGILADLELNRIALEALKAGHDTMSVSLTRDGKAIKLKTQIDEGILRFVGMTLSKFVKDNLADE
ncbi:MAG: hypothetical protein ACKV0T_15710 [Planctomycetales bacterium]